MAIGKSQLIESTVYDAIVRSWFWLTATTSWPFGLLQLNYCKQLKIDRQRPWYSRFVAVGLLAIEHFTLFSKQDKHQDLVGSSAESKSSSVHLCQNLNPFTWHSTLNVAGSKSVSIFNFIMTKDLHFNSSETNYNYLFIAYLINKSNNLRSQEFNDICWKML